MKMLLWPKPNMRSVLRKMPTERETFFFRFFYHKLELTTICVCVNAATN